MAHDFEDRAITRGRAGLRFTAGDDHPGTGQHEPLGQRKTDSAGAPGHNHGAISHVEQSVKSCAIHASSRSDRPADVRETGPQQPTARPSDRSPTLYADPFEGRT